MTDLLSFAELAGIERLTAARTQGEWESDTWGTIRSEHQIIAFTGGSDNGLANAAFIADCSISVPRMLHTIALVQMALKAWVKVAHMAPTDDHDECIAAQAAAMYATEAAGIHWEKGVWEVEE